MASSSNVSLTCAQCGYVNEPERVYCHNCGVKLDRSVLPKEDAKKRESIHETRRRVKRMTNPSANPLTRELKSLCVTLFWAALTAALIQMVREPADAPPARQELGDRLVSSDLALALESPQARTVQFSELDVNSYLRSQLRTKAKGWMPGAEFKRGYVRLNPDEVRIGMEQSLWGYSLYSGVTYDIGVTPAGEFYAKQKGASFGRLSLHPVIMQVGNSAFGKMWNALKKEHDQMKRMSYVKVEKGKITLVTRPPAPR